MPLARLMGGIANNNEPGSQRQRARQAPGMRSWAIRNIACHPLAARECPMSDADSLQGRGNFARRPCPVV